MIPSEIIHVEKLPMLGSGKVDMLTLQTTARDYAAAAQAAKAAVVA
jgi:hypothetical protein